MAVKIEIDVDAAKAASDLTALKQASEELKKATIEEALAQKEAAKARKEAAEGAKFLADIERDQEKSRKESAKSLLSSIKEQKDAEAQLAKETISAAKAAADAQKKMDKEQADSIKASSEAHAFAIGKVMIAYDIFKAGLGLAIDAIKGVANAFIGAVNEAVQFEKALTEIQSIAPTTDMQALAKSLLDVSSAWGVDKITAANAQYDIMSSGITDAGEAFKVFEGAAKLAVATGAQTSETAKTITAAINAWGMSASDVGQVMDSLAITTQDGVVRMSELGPVFGQVAATAASAGVTLQELNSGIAALTLGGTPAAQAGTQLKAVIAGLLKPSEELAAAFKAQAGESTASYLASNGLAKTLEVLKVVTKGSAEETSRLFGSQEAVAGLLPLITTQSDNFTKSLAKQNAAITEGGKVTQDMADIMSQSASFQMNKLSESITNVTTELGMNFTGVLAGAAKVLNEFVDSIATFVRDNEAGFKRVSDAVSGFITSFAEITKAIVQSEEFKAVLSGLKDIATATFDALKEAASTYSEAIKQAFKDSSLSVQDYQNIMLALKAVVIPTIEAIIKLTTFFAVDTVRQYGAMIQVISSFIGIFSKQESISASIEDSNKKISKSAKDAGYSTLFQKDAEDQLNKSIQNSLGNTPQLLGDLEKKNKLVKISSEMEKTHATEVKKNSDVQKKASVENVAAKKAEIEARKLADENESQASANQIDRLNDYRSNYDSFSKGITATRMQTALDGKEIDDRMAKEKEKAIEHEYKQSLEYLDKLSKAKEEIAKRDEEAAKARGKAAVEGTDVNYNDKSFADNYQATAKKAAELGDINSAAAYESITAWKYYAESLRGIFSGLSEVFSKSFSGISAIASGDLFGGIKTSIEGVFSGLGNSFTTVVNTFPKLLRDIAPGISSAIDSAFAIIPESIKAKASVAVGVMVDGFVGAAKLFSDALSSAYTVSTEGLKTGLKAVSGGFLADFASGVSGILSGIEGTLSGITGGTATIETFAKKTEGDANIFGDISKAIADFTAGFVKNIPSIVAGFAKGVPKIVTELSKAAPQIIQSLAQNIGPVIAAIASGIPEIVKSITDNLPIIVQALIANLPALFDALIISVPPLISSVIMSLVQMLPIILPKLLELVTSVILEVIKNIPIIITAIMTFIPQLIAQIPIIIQALLQQLPSIINSIISGLPAIFKAIILAVPSIIISFVQNLPTIISALILAIPTIILQLVSAIIGALPEIVSSLFTELVLGFPDMVKSLWNEIWNGLKNIGGLFTDIASNIWKAIKSAFNAVTDFLGDLIPNLWGKGKLENWMGIDVPFVKFAKGGVVGGKARVAGDSPFNDTVPAMLSPGEIVVPRTIVQSGFSGISQFLKGLSPSTLSANQAGAGMGSLVPGGTERHSWFGDTWGAVKGAVNSIGDSIAGAPIIGDLISGAGDAMNWVYDQVSDGVLTPIISQLPSPVPEMWDFVKGALRPTELLGTMKDFILDPLKTSENILKSSWDGLFKPMLKATGIPLFDNMSQGGISNGGRTMVSPGEMILPSMSSISRPAYSPSSSSNIGGMFNTSALESRLLSLEMSMREVGYAIAKTSLRTSNLLSEWDQIGIPETRTI